MSGDRGSRTDAARRRAAAMLAAVLVGVGFAPAATAATAADGYTYTWGANGDGQLGRSGTANRPGLVASIPRTRALSGGLSHSVALTTDGAVWAWGGNFLGQLGRGTFGSLSGSSSPAAVTGLANIVSIASGDDHTLALDSAGSVWAWGSNASGQLSLNPQTVGFAALPRTVTGIPAGVTVTAIAAGGNHSLALGSDGILYGWGANDRGQLGVSGLTGVVPAAFTPRPVGLPAGRVTAFAAGGKHSAAIVDGVVHAWGDNNRSQLAQADTLGQFNPVPTATTVTGATAVAAGGWHTLALTPSGVVSWGDNGKSQLGHTGNAPAAVTGLSGATAVVAGREHSLAIVRTGSGGTATGSVWTWGSNAAGQLGRAGTASTAAAAPTLETAVVVGAGADHTLAAAAPRATLAPAALDFEAAFGVTALGSATGTLTATLTNQGPGALQVAEATADGSDFAIASDLCKGTTLAAGATCTVKVKFSPLDVGPRRGTLTVPQSGFATALTVALSGRSAIVDGELEVITDLTYLRDGVPASPADVPLRDIPLQASSPMADELSTGEIPLNDLSGIGDLPLNDLSGIGDLPLNDLSGIGDLPLNDLSGIGDLPLNDLSGIGDLPLNDLSGIGDHAAEALSGVTLASLPLHRGYAWDGPDPADAKAILAASPNLHGRPLQELTLLDLLRDATAAARFRAVPISAVGWAASPLGGVSLLALLLGDTPLAQLATSGDSSWCAQLEAARRPDCGTGYGRKTSPADGLSASAYEHQLAGLPPAALDLAAVPLGELAASDAPALDILLSRVPLFQSNLGGITLGSVPADRRSSVVDCSRVSCADGSTVTLYQASLGASPALRSSATVGDLGAAVSELTLGRLVLGLLPLSQLPYGAVSLRDLWVTPYGGGDAATPPTSFKLPYTVRFTNTTSNPLPAGATVTVQLPKDFVYLPHSSTLTVTTASGSTSSTPVEVSSGDGRTYTWPVPLAVPAGATMRLRFEARPGLRLGTFTVDRVSVRAGSLVRERTTSFAPVRVVDAETAYGRNDGASTASPITPATGGTAGSMRIGHISSAADEDWYQFPATGIAPGSMIVAYLDHQVSGDADLFLYGDAAMQATAPLRAAAPDQTLVPVRDRPIGMTSVHTTVESDVQGDQPVASLPLLGISQLRGTENEVVTAVAPVAPAGGVYRIQVAGYNRGFSDDAHTVRVTVIPPPALPTIPAQTLAPSSGSVNVLGSNLAAARTVFLTAPGRMTALHGSSTAVTDALADPALTTVIGPYAVLAVERDATVKAKYAAWDAAPADPEKANDVVRAINALVDSLLDERALRYVVVVGGDRVVPMARLDDLTATVNERTYAAEMAALADPTKPGNSLFAATATGHVLSDDPYAALSPRPVVGLQHLYTPDMAIGRLVETPAEISGLVRRFVQFGGVLDPSTALTTSAARFLDDLGVEIDRRLGKVAESRQKLIGADWGLDLLKQSFTNAAAAPDVVSFNGHSDPLRTDTGTSDEASELFTTADVLAGNGLGDAVTMTVGCHTGTPVADSLLRAGLPPEWSQALPGKGAAGFVGQTGYGIGSRSTIALTEELLVRYAGRLADRSVGEALAEAKREYLADAGVVSELDLKTVPQAAQFGMPHLRFSGVSATPPAAGDPVSAVESQPFSAQSDDPNAAGYYGLQRVDGADGSYYSADGDATAGPMLPLQPGFTRRYDRAGGEVRGLLLRGARSFEAQGAGGGAFDPVLLRAIEAGNGVSLAEPQVKDVSYPANLWTTSGDRLHVATGLFRSTGFDANGRTVGSQTVFRSLTGEVFVAPAAGDAGDRPPIIRSTDAVVAGGIATFAVEATDDVDVTEVVVLYREVPDDGPLPPVSTWSSLSLLRSATDPSRWTGGIPVTAGRVEVMSQAVDTAKHVSTSTNKARLTPSRTIVPPPPGTVDVEIGGVPAPGNVAGSPDGWWRIATVELRATVPGATLTARIDGGAPILVDGPLVVAGEGVPDLPPGAVVADGYHVIAWRTSTGESGVVVVRADGVGPTVTVSPGQADLVLGSPANLAFACSDDASGIASCLATLDGAPVVNGAALPTSDPGEHIVVVTAKDTAGNTTVVRRTFRVAYRFEGWLQPILNRPNINLWSAGQTVPFKFRLLDASGNQISRLDVVSSAGSYPINCTTTEVTGGGSANGVQEGLIRSGDHYQFGWRTENGWKQSCRRFVMVLDDASAHDADFKFR